MSVLDAGCPTRDVLDRLADRWSLLVVLVLAGGPLRFGELRRGIGGISPRMLTVTLRRLERDGLLARDVVSERPPVVRYALTARGRSLLAVVDGLRTWAELHWEEVQADRERFDAAPPAPAPWQEPGPWAAGPVSPPRAAAR